MKDVLVAIIILASCFAVAIAANAVVPESVAYNLRYLITVIAQCFLAVIIVPLFVTLMLESVRVMAGVIRQEAILR